MNTSSEHDLSTQGARLRWARINAGYKSAGPAAEAIGVKESTYRAHENGQNEFNYKRAAQYAEAYGVALEWLMMNADDPKAQIVVRGNRGPAVGDFVSSNGIALEAKSHQPNVSFPPAFQKFPDATIPLMGQTIGGPNGRFILNGQEIARVFCPPDLAGIEGAYAVQVYGTSMEPKFEAGETVWLHPYTPVRSGDYVVAQILSDDSETPESYLKKFVSQSSKVLRMRQLNPEEGEPYDLEFPTERVFSVHKVVFQALV